MRRGERVRESGRATKREPEGDRNRDRLTESEISERENVITLNDLFMSTNSQCLY